MAIVKTTGTASALSRAQIANAARLSALAARHGRAPRVTPSMDVWNMIPGSARAVFTPDLTRGQIASAARFTGQALARNLVPNRLSPGVAHNLGIEEETRRRHYETDFGYRLLNQGAAETAGGRVGWGGGGGGGGGQAEQEPVTWSVGYKVPGAPSWWRGLVPSRATEESSYIALVNAVLPFMSPEDQRSIVGNLATQEGIGEFYGGNVFAPPPGELTTQMRQQFTSAERARQALASIERMRAASKIERKEFGPGYQYLRNVISTMRDFGGAAGDMQSRQKRMQFLAALDPLLNQARAGALGAYGAAASALGQPFFSARNLVPVQRTEDGSYVFGRRNVQFGG